MGQALRRAAGRARSSSLESPPQPPPPPPNIERRPRVIPSEPRVSRSDGGDRPAVSNPGEWNTAIQESKKKITTERIFFFFCSWCVWMDLKPFRLREYRVFHSIPVVWFGRWKCGFWFALAAYGNRFRSGVHPNGTVDECFSYKFHSSALDCELWVSLVELKLIAVVVGIILILLFC